MKFRTRYYPARQTRIIEEFLDANTEAELRERLTHAGHTVLGIQAVRRSWIKDAHAAPDYPTFCKELRTLLHAGMTVVEAVDTLAVNLVHPTATSHLAAQLHDQLAQGQALSQALERLGSAPAVLLAAVRSGERTSNLAQALDDYLTYQQMMAGLRSKVVSAAIYPALISALGLGITLFILMVVMPNFARMYESLKGNAKGLTSFVISLSDFMNSYRAEVFVGLVLLASTTIAFVRAGLVKQALLKAAWAIKPMRRQLEHFQLAMLYQTLHLLIKGGYPVTQAMTIAGEAALNVHMRQALKRALLLVEQGKPIAQTLFDQGLCSEVDRRLMAAAERSGDFYRVAHVVSGLHRELFETFVERLTRIIEPALILFVALMVGSMVVMMYLPVFQMTTQLR